MRILPLLIVLASCGGSSSKAKVTIGGTVTGLRGMGLVLSNGHENLAITADGAFAFPTPLTEGDAYAITVTAQPSSPMQTCAVTGGTGTATDDVTDVVVTCTTSMFTVSGTVTGLAGTGMVLQNNGVDDLAIAMNGTFTFATPIASGASFAVTVKNQPANPSQTCTVNGGSGTIGAANVTTVVIDCVVDRFSIGGTISGLAGSVVLQNNGGDNITVTANGTFAFPTTAISGAAYNVTVLTQPLSPISQNCVVTAGSGTVANADVTSVVVTCTTNRFAISGTLSGLAAGTSVLLQNNGADAIVLTANGQFMFPTAVASGQTYAVTSTNPTTPVSQTCMVMNGSGTVGAAPITNVAVTCTTNSFLVGGMVSGLTASGLVLRNNGGDDLAISSNGAFTFATPVPSGQTYSVTVFGQPTPQTCTVSSGTGTVGNMNVTNVVVNCSTTPTYTIGGAVSGLTSAGLVLRNNGGDDLPISANGSFTFATPVAMGQPYNVTVFAQPASEMCTVANGSGTVGSMNVTNVVVTCGTTPTCATLLTNASMWGNTARGLDLRGYANGTLDWIGCTLGCTPASFFCTDEATGIFFGTTETTTLRALVDPGNAAGTVFPTSYNNAVNGGCCASAAPRNVCNAPRAANNGVGGINSGDALCKALGFASGVVVAEGTGNTCPKPHSTTASGSDWTSNWANTDGYGRQYRCTR